MAPSVSSNKRLSWLSQSFSGCLDEATAGIVQAAGGRDPTTLVQALSSCHARQAHRSAVSRTLGLGTFLALAFLQKAACSSFFTDAGSRWLQQWLATGLLAELLLAAALVVGVRAWRAQDAEATKRQSLFSRQNSDDTSTSATSTSASSTSWPSEGDALSYAAASDCSEGPQVSLLRLLRRASRAWRCSWLLWGLAIVAAVATTGELSLLVVCAVCVGLWQSFALAAATRDRLELAEVARGVSAGILLSSRPSFYRDRPQPDVVHRAKTLPSLPPLRMHELQLGSGRQFRDHSTPGPSDPRFGLPMPSATGKVVFAPNTWSGMV
eukprot:gb/GFBE01060194.1/.p1 GENE.gb/GFBE01060194.1/~~gb/GFBE01060194.1/.p1  ORF type:complete len:324 (+),score=38.85 gb/GFBE01060194.1/:1-972(+)